MRPSPAPPQRAHRAEFAQWQRRAVRPCSHRRTPKYLSGRTACSNRHRLVPQNGKAARASARGDDGIHVEEFSLAHARDRRGSGGRNHALVGLSIGERRLEVHHRLHHSHRLEERHHSAHRKKPFEGGPGHRAVLSSLSRIRPSLLQPTSPLPCASPCARQVHPCCPSRSGGHSEA